MNEILKSAPLAPTLDTAEQQQWRELDGVVKRCRDQIWEAGKALLIINQKRLYRDEFETFEDYCRERLNISRPYAYNLMDAAKVSEQLSAIADIPVKPSNEAQFRELVAVPEEHRVAAWKGAVILAGDKPVTAKIVRQASAEFKPEKIKLAIQPTQKPSGDIEPVRLDAVLEQMARVEKAATEIKAEKVLDELLALRKLIEKFAGKSSSS